MNPFQKRRKEVDQLRRLKNKPTLRRAGSGSCKTCGGALDESNGICLACGAYHAMTAYQRIQSLADHHTFVEMPGEVAQRNPIDFPGYSEKRSQVQQTTQLTEGVVVGVCRMGKTKVCLGVMDTRFFMGSMGTVVGERITRLIEHATKRGLPLVLVCASGGARMQEGIFSLMQMAKTAAALQRHSDKGLLYISVLTNPTTGGVTASFASLGDIILAEPKALIGFAGPKVIENTIHQKLPEGFQSSEFLLEHGFLDGIVPREELRPALIQLLKLHGGGR